jgi:hypothetical protein
VTPEAILQSADALTKALANAAPEYRPQLDRLWCVPISNGAKAT